MFRSGVAGDDGALLVTSDGDNDDVGVLLGVDTAGGVDGPRLGGDCVGALLVPPIGPADGVSGVGGRIL